MSQSGRGLGRAGRSQDPRKRPCASSSSSSSSTSGRTQPAPKCRFSELAIGDTKPTSEPSTSKPAESDPSSGSGDKKGTSSNPQLGRGGFRGRRKIATFEVLKTKPASCRNKHGDYGKKVTLIANYFRLKSFTDWVLYQYRVDFSVEEDRESVLRAWLREHKDRLTSAYIFDGTMLFTSQRLTPPNETLTLTSIRESDKTPVKIVLKLVQALDHGNPVYLQIFNILLRRCLVHLDLKLVSRNYFDPASSIRLPQHNLEIWPGYITSIKQHENDVLMCAELSHKVVRTDTALKFLNECLRDGKDYRQVFLQGIVGSIVLTDYNNKTYRVDDVDFSQTPLSTFKYRSNEDISYVRYYEQRYQIRITDMRQPLLISRSSEKKVKAGADKQCLLIPELCRMTGLSSKMLENRNLMKDLSEVTRVPPGVRVDKLKKFSARLESEPKVEEDFKRWGMSLERDLITVPGRQLPPETIIVGNRLTYPAGQDVDWTKSLRSNPMLQVCERFENFVVIFPERFKRDVEDFLGAVKRASDAMSFKIPRPYLVETNSDNLVEMIEVTEKICGKGQPDMIMYVFATDRSDRYAAIKRKCYVDRGLLSQVVLSRSLRSKNMMTVAMKVAVQMNCKLGGAPWTIHIPAENIMVVGFDVCHLKKKNVESVGAVVASLNKTMSAWYTSVDIQPAGVEISQTVASEVGKAVKKYREINNVLPTRILFYRDGVGEGQITQVYEQEVDALQKELTDVYGGQTWKLAFIIVSKRINTRFFEDGKNPIPGTIVDDVVTKPERYDFYLVSQSVRQGTVSPTNYNVICDNLEWSCNNIQRLTYKMTHLYFNCSTTVRVPAPCQYAHKLALMVGQSLRDKPHPCLNQKLYFL